MAQFTLSAKDQTGKMRHQGGHAPADPANEYPNIVAEALPLRSMQTPIAIVGTDREDFIQTGYVNDLLLHYRMICDDGAKKTVYSMRNVS